MEITVKERKEWAKEKKRKEDERWIGEDKLEGKKRKMTNKYWRMKRIKRKKSIQRST